jgi:hypothetical protein
MNLDLDTVWIWWKGTDSRIKDIIKYSCGICHHPIVLQSPPRGSDISDRGIKKSDCSHNIRVRRLAVTRKSWKDFFDRIIKSNLLEDLDPRELLIVVGDHAVALHKDISFDSH